MYTAITNIRVRYGETDQMGMVYYGNFALYYEQGRTEAIRDLGFSYRKMETELGIKLPVIEMNIKYRQPARYDDLLKVKSTILEMPGRKLIFQTDIYNEDDVLLNTGITTLLFVNSNTGRPCSAPSTLVDLLKPYYK